MNSKSIREKVIDFWNSFKEREEEIRELIDTRKLGENFNRVEELFEVDMPFMLGMSVDNKYELILNPSGLKSRYFIADYFKRKMPDELKEKWNFYDMKPPMNIKNMQFSINNDLFLENDFSVAVKNVNKENKRVNISVSCPKFHKLFKKYELKDKYNVVYNIMDGLLGEAIVESYLGEIDIQKNNKDSSEFTLEEFKAEIAGIIEKNEWGKNPKILDRYDSYSYDLDKVEDTNPVRYDVIVGFTSNLTVVDGYRHDTTEFDYMQEQGCVYGMLFYNNTNIPNNEKIAVRDRLENLLAETSEYGDIFEIFGAATGINNSYIDVIIYDVNKFYYLLERINLSDEYLSFSYKDFKPNAELRKIVSQSVLPS